MPKVIGYTPPYLSRPSPGSKIFTDPEPQSPVSPSKRSSYLSSPPQTQCQGPRRLLASRNTEIFTVVGNKIRWADLATVRDEWEESTQSGTSRFGLSRSATTEDAEGTVYRTLAVPIYYQIRQISISPSGFFLAISTEHTVHIAVLPDSSRLKEQDRSPLKVKTYQLGPTVHVIPESPLASVLWHPLAYSTTSMDCLVTVTAEAAVRLWEFDKSSNWSLDRPKLAIDLRKLADGVSCDQDFEPSGFGKTRGFSVDDFDMEVSAACFGGRGGDDEDGWASMTLWVAMRNGDIYALCPLLPSKWKPTSTTIPSLTTTAVSRMASINDDETDVDERRAVDQQYEWVQEIDNEHPQIHLSTDRAEQFEVRLRPQNPSAIPRLQGPFAITPEDDTTEIEISDIYVFSARLDEEDLFDGEDDEVHVQSFTPVPFTTICVATPENQVSIAIDLDGVTGQWLPKKGKSAFTVPSSDTKLLTLIDTLILKEQTLNTEANWPVFTPDILHNYSLFLNTADTVYSFSLTDWITQLGAELIGTESVDPGLRTRLETRCQNQICVTNKLIEAVEPSEIISAPTLIDNDSVGYMLLTTTIYTSYGVVFDRDYLNASLLTLSTTEFTTSSPSRLSSQLVTVLEPRVETVPAREPYGPPKIFYDNQHIPIDSLRKRLPPYFRKAVAERPMKLSPAMLEIMAFTHRVVGVQSAHLENAAAELFRRCERLRDELGSQVKQITELAQQLQRLTATRGEDESGDTYRIKGPEERIYDAQERQRKLVARYEALRRKVGRAGSAKRELSSKESAWIEETDMLGKNVGVDSEEEKEPESDTKDTTLNKRFETVKRLTHTLVQESHRLDKQQQPQQSQSQSPYQTPRHPPPLDASTSSMSNSSITPSMSASQMTVTSRSSASPRSSVFSAGLGVSSRVQKERIADVMGLVEREGRLLRPR